LVWNPAWGAILPLPEIILLVSKQKQCFSVKKLAAQKIAPSFVWWYKYEADYPE
jgi:hypothetical protein